MKPGQLLVDKEDLKLKQREEEEELLLRIMKEQEDRELARTAANEEE